MSRGTWLAEDIQEARELRLSLRVEILSGMESGSFRNASSWTVTMSMYMDCSPFFPERAIRLSLAACSRAIFFSMMSYSSGILPMRL